MSGQYDVIIIGSGPNGLAIGAYLSKAGQKVLLLEKNAQAGGKTMTVSKKGFRYEFWPICGGPAQGARFQEVIRRLGLEDVIEVWLPDYLAKAHYRDPSGEMRTLVLPGTKGLEDPEKILNDLMAFLGVTDKDLPEVLRLMGDLMGMSPHDVAAHDDVTVKEFLDCYQIPRSVYSFLATIRCEATMEVPIDAGSYGLGFHQAVDSGIKAAEAVRLYQTTHKL